jgi:hypothetical protein
MLKKKKRQEGKKSAPRHIYRTRFLFSRSLPASSLVTCNISSFFFFLLWSRTAHSIRTSSHVARTQPCESVGAMSSTARKALEIFTLVAHVSGGISIHYGRVLCERIHVPAERHGGAALWSLHLRLLRRGLDTSGYAVFGEGLEWSLGSELGVVVEGEDGGLVRSWSVGLILLLLQLRRILLLLLHLLGRHGGLLRCHMLLLHLLLGHTRLLRSQLCLPERILSRTRRHHLLS